MAVAFNPALRIQKQRILGASWVAELTELVSCGFSERPCLNKSGGKFRKIPSINFGTRCVLANIYTNTCIQHSYAQRRIRKF